MGFARSLSTALVLVATAGCESNQPLFDVPRFNDITSASAPIKKAARAVVRVEVGDSFGTGSFISEDGLLMTNNHVLGAPACPIEGCSITLTFLHQRGEDDRVESVFVVPVTVDEGLDLAVVQIYSTPNDVSGGKLATPDYLTWNRKSASALVGGHVTIVGHPEARLKKWTDGVVYDVLGEWFSSSAYILPGDSGSPVLDDSGRIVGLIHHSITGNDLVTAEGADETSNGTPSDLLEAAMGEPLPASMISVLATTTAARVVANDFVYLNGNTANVTADGVVTNVLSLLGTACDAAIASADTTVKLFDALGTALQPCFDATQWIECRTDETTTLVAKGCPSSDDIALWKTRFQQTNQLYVSANGAPQFSLVSFDVAALSPSKADGIQAGAAGLQQVLAATKLPLDFTVANFLAAFEVTAYDGSSVPDYVTGYRKRPDYEFSAQTIASAAGWLMDNGLVSKETTRGIFSDLMGDPKVTTGASLYIEQFQYDERWIQ